MNQKVYLLLKNVHTQAILFPQISFVIILTTHFSNVLFPGHILYNFQLKSTGSLFDTSPFS